MCTLAHWFEQAGLSTVAIVPIRLHAERIRPPRALWVPFELGRPLGAPGDAAFQRRVLKAAFGLLDRPEGPVLADFGEEAPATAASEDAEAFVCPVSFPPPEATAGDPVAAVAEEMRRLRPWFDLARETRGRSTFGASGLAPEDLPDALGRVAAGEPPHVARDGVRPAQALKHLADDLVAYYQEAATARPGAAANSRAVLEWFWSETRAADLLLAVRAAAARSPDKGLAVTAERTLVPGAVAAVVARRGSARS